MMSCGIQCTLGKCAICQHDPIVVCYCTSCARPENEEIIEFFSKETEEGTDLQHENNV